MEEIFLAGRILVGGFYLLSAFHHFSELGSLAQYAGLLGVPLPARWRSRSRASCSPSGV